MNTAAHSQNEIAELLARSALTVNRALRRNRGGKIKNRVASDERPVIVESRRRTGDWKADTVLRLLGAGHQ